MKARIKTEEEFLKTDKIYRLGNGGFGIEDDSFETEFTFGPENFPSMEKYLGETVKLKEKEGKYYFEDGEYIFLAEPWIIAEFID